MRILYGVVGEGMGHATRSRVTLTHLAAQGHEVKVVVSGRAHDFLARAFSEVDGVTIDEIAGLQLVYEQGEVDVSASVRTNLVDAADSYRQNFTAYRRIVGEFQAEAVISDFESWAWYYGRKHRVPVISIDNMQVINRCAHDAFVTDNRAFDFRLAKLAVKAKVPGCYHYLVSSFFFPPVRKARTSLVPPILRPEILAAQRQPGEHILVYHHSAESLIPLLKQTEFQFRVYGPNREARDGNVTLRAFSQEGFIEDLRTARAVIGGGGYSLMGECVHLRVPLLALPLEGQYEQELNARYLAKLGYGRFAPQLSQQVLSDFLAGLDAHDEALSAYVPRGNEVLLAALDELLERVRLGETAPDVLQSPTLGDRWV
jgi:uncharacterized protein (TIGR00661 family)